MVSDWGALHYLAAVAVERSNDPTSHVGDELLNSVCPQLFIFISVTNYTSRACTFFHFPPAILHS